MYLGSGRMACRSSLHARGSHPRNRDLGFPCFGEDDPGDRTQIHLSGAKMQRNDNATMPILVEALRSTIQSLERNEELSPDDPALREIKSSILRAIAARETRGNGGVDPQDLETASENAA